MKKLFCVVLALTVGTAAVRAQNYNWGIGLRGGLIAAGLDAKVNFDPRNALEMILAVNEGVCFYGLYERQVPVIARGFNFYYGAGAHAGTWGWGNDNDFTFGVDAVVGLEYSIKEAPITFAVDYKPCFNFTGKTGFKGQDFGLSVRYTF